MDYNKGGGGYDAMNGYPNYYDDDEVYENKSSGVSFRKLLAALRARRARKKRKERRKRRRNRERAGLPPVGSSSSSSSDDDDSLKNHRRPTRRISAIGKPFKPPSFVPSSQIQTSSVSSSIPVSFPINVPTTTLPRSTIPPFNPSLHSPPILSPHSTTATTAAPYPTYPPGCTFIGSTISTLNPYTGSYQTSGFINSPTTNSTFPLHSTYPHLNKQSSIMPTNQIPSFNADPTHQPQMMNMGQVVTNAALKDPRGYDLLGFSDSRRLQSPSLINYRKDFKLPSTNGFESMNGSNQITHKEGITQRVIGEPLRVWNALNESNLNNGFNKSILIDVKIERMHSTIRSKQQLTYNQGRLQNFPVNQLISRILQPYQMQFESDYYQLVLENNVIMNGNKRMGDYVIPDGSTIRLRPRKTQGRITVNSSVKGNTGSNHLLLKDDSDKQSTSSSGSSYNGNSFVRPVTTTGLSHLTNGKTKINKDFLNDVLY